ncbi:hypothetical protein Tco_0345752 [Tanacetum coccineum]
MPHDLPLPGGHTPISDKGSLPLHELTVLCTKLSNKVESSETELKQTKPIYGDGFTKLIKKVKKISLVPPQVSIAVPKVTTVDAELNTSAAKTKGKAIMQESKQPKKIKKRIQIQMSLDEELSQKLHEEEQARFNAEQEA